MTNLDDYRLPSDLERDLKTLLADWTGSEDSEIRQRGKRFSVDFSDWQDLTLDELTVCLGGFTIQEGHTHAAFAARLRS